MNVANVYTKTSAIISKCGKYRYELTREWESNFRRADRPKSVTFIMLNPSTADASEDDPTIRRCVSFAKAQNAIKLIVVNLFAYRTFSVSELKAVRYDTDIIGPEYWDRLRKTLAKSETIVCAWGAHGSLLDQDALVYEYVKETHNWLFALTINSDGSPKHPLYIRGDAKKVPYVREAVTEKTISRFHTNVLSGKAAKPHRREE